MTLPDLVLLAARHLDEEEGPCKLGHALTTADLAAIRTVLRYVAQQNKGQ